MDERTKELIAIGASVATNCQPCLTHHVDKADEIGIDEAEIREALAIGAQVQKGGVNAMQRFVEQSFASTADDATKDDAGKKIKKEAGVLPFAGNTSSGSGECCPGGGCC